MKLSYTVNLDDLDFMGIVSHYQWIVLMERLRTKLLSKPFIELQKLGLGIVIAEVHMQYKKPARYNDHMDFELEVIEARSSSIKLKHIFQSNNGKVFTIGELVMVCINDQGKPHPIPPKFIENLNA